MAAPDLTVVKAYLNEADDSLVAKWGDTAITGALAAEKAAQSRVCRVPTDPDAEWPADLTEALCRRVAANLAARAVPSGVQSTLTEFGPTTARIGGIDREVRRLEGPFRKVVLG